MKIAKLRKKIDIIDGHILNLLEERARLSLSIGRTKSKKGANVYAPDREEEVYKKVIHRNKGPLSERSIKAVYREIMSASRSVQTALNIAYFGPRATFTHIAALKKFGASVDYVECAGIGEVFTEVERGRADYGVVPIENSTEGAVNYTLDIFVDSELKICSEVYLPIEHHLISRAKKLSSIKTVYSHEQVFAQCRLWLEANLPRATLTPVSSTTAAAVYALSGKKSAAITSKLAAEIYGGRLKILARSIQDSPHNITRFLVIGKHEVNPTRRDKTSVMFTMKDRAGALHDILAPFKKNRINLTKIESRPSKKKAWKYYFFVDMEGHRDEKNVKKALAALKKKCLLLKVLGSYPKST